MCAEPKKKQIPIKKIDLEGSNIVRDVQTTPFKEKVIRPARVSAIVGTFNSNGAASALRYGGDLKTPESSSKLNFVAPSKEMGTPMIAKRGSKPVRAR